MEAMREVLDAAAKFRELAEKQPDPLVRAVFLNIADELDADNERLLGLHASLKSPVIDPTPLR
jgi:hypothetical protein